MSKYVIQTPNGTNYLTAVNEGGMGAGANVPIRTDATVVGSNELFTLVSVNLDTNQYALLTAKGNYVTFVNEGGIGGPNSDESPLHTDATKIGSWEIFTLIPQPNGKYAIQAPNAINYLSAVNGGGYGGPNNYPIHTDATKIGPWEIFTLLRQN